MPRIALAIALGSGRNPARMTLGRFRNCADFITGRDEPSGRKKPLCVSVGMTVNVKRQSMRDIAQGEIIGTGNGNRNFLSERLEIQRNGNSAGRPACEVMQTGSRIPASVR